MSVFDNVAARLKEAIPKRPDGKTITAWDEFAKRMNRMAGEVADLQNRVSALEGEPPPPEPEPEPEPPPAARLAPQTYNLGSGNQDPRFCVAGLPTNSANERFEPSDPGIRYDQDGLNKIGRNRNKVVAGLKPADQMDGRSACDGYDGFPGGLNGWPEESYKP